MCKAGSSGAEIGLADIEDSTDGSVWISKACEHYKMSFFLVEIGELTEQDIEKVRVYGGEYDFGVGVRVCVRDEFPGRFNGFGQKVARIALMDVIDAYYFAHSSVSQAEEIHQRRVGRSVLRQFLFKVFSCRLFLLFFPAEAADFGFCLPGKLGKLPVEVFH